MVTTGSIERLAEQLECQLDQLEQLWHGRRPSTRYQSRCPEACEVAEAVVEVATGEHGGSMAEQRRLVTLLNLRLVAEWLYSGLMTAADEERAKQTILALALQLPADEDARRYGGQS